MVEITESVKKCVSILRAASSDTEKFAALFMVTKLIKSSDCNTHSKKLILEAIGFKFLKRLLLCHDVTADCPPSVYRSVALSVLSSFCSDPDLATHPDILTNIPVFFEIIQKSDDDDDLDENLMAINEAYACLCGIASTKVGQEELLKAKAVTTMCELYSHQSFQTDQALNILVTLVSRFGPSVWEENTKPFHAIMTKIALDFKTDNSDRKFELCEILNALLVNTSKSISVTNMKEESWPASIYKGLNDILRSKIGRNQRNPALKLASLMVELCGVEWTFSDEENPHYLFLLLLLQLCCVEIRMQLEDRTINDILKNADLLTACFTILELSIAYMAQDLLDLEEKEKQNLYVSLKGAFTAVITTLQSFSKSYQKDRSKMKPEEIVFTIAMVRVLAAWLAQETTSMRSAVYQILPFILTIANDTFYACRQKKMENEENGASSKTKTNDLFAQCDVFRIMFPALCHLTVEEEARKLMLSLNEEEILYQAFVFHWSKMLVKTPKKKKPKNEIIEEVKNLSLSESSAGEGAEERKDSKTAIISLCNIFMNLTVLEPKLAEESPTFSTLLKFILNNLTDLKDDSDNLVLIGNLSILGLLLLKQQSKKIKKNDFSICRFIQSTIRFLWDAYCIDESVDASSLSVSMKYKQYWPELMELWFLGMQTISAILILIPWLSDFAIESGWAEGIIEMLNNVKKGCLPSNTKSAYEDFFCNLIEADKNLVKILKDKGALTMCKTHHFIELEKKMR